MMKHTPRNNLQSKTKIRSNPNRSKAQPNQVDIQVSPSSPAPSIGLKPSKKPGRHGMYRNSTAAYTLLSNSTQNKHPIENSALLIEQLNLTIKEKEEEINQLMRANTRYKSTHNKLKCVLGLQAQTHSRTTNLASLPLTEHVTNTRATALAHQSSYLPSTPPDIAPKRSQPSPVSDDQPADERVSNTTIQLARTTATAPNHCYLNHAAITQMSASIYPASSPSTLCTPPPSPQQLSSATKIQLSPVRSDLSNASTCLQNEIPPDHPLTTPFCLDHLANPQIACPTPTNNSSEANNSCLTPLGFFMPVTSLDEEVAPDMISNDLSESSSSNQPSQAPVPFLPIISPPPSLLMPCATSKPVTKAIARSPNQTACKHLNAQTSHTKTIQSKSNADKQVQAAQRKTLTSSRVKNRVKTKKSNQKLLTHGYQTPLQTLGYCKTKLAFLIKGAIMGAVPILIYYSFIRDRWRSSCHSLDDGRLRLCDYCHPEPSRWVCPALFEQAITATGLPLKCTEPDCIKPKPHC
ncbi:MAG: hypothetical protein VXY77_02790 [Pseudomonadota bacterium]|nr:hypothetical protein [Pseudomonadota bacterium]